jgi:hypothetical protein
VLLRSGVADLSVRRALNSGRRPSEPALRRSERLTRRFKPLSELRDWASADPERKRSGEENSPTCLQPPRGCSMGAIQRAERRCQALERPRHRSHALSGPWECFLGDSERLWGVADRLHGLAERLPGVAERLRGLAERLPGVAEGLRGQPESLPGVAESPQRSAGEPPPSIGETSSAGARRPGSCGEAPTHLRRGAEPIAKASRAARALAAADRERSAGPNRRAGGEAVT